MNGKEAVNWAVVLLGAALLLVNSALLLTPTGAASCTVDCGEAGPEDDCTCTGTSCDGEDEVGCSGEGAGGATSSCNCKKEEIV